MNMENLKDSLTEKNLARAWFLETANIRRCEIFAKQIKKEGFEQISDILLEVAEQKRSHTKTILRFLETCKVDLAISFSSEPSSSALDCLKTLSDIELHESELIFEEIERVALDEGFKTIAMKIKLFKKIKLFYHQRYSKLISNLEEGKAFERDEEVKWICRKCGFIYEGTRALKNCPGCEHPQAYFEILAENY